MGMRRRTSAAKGLSFFSLHAVRKGFTLVELLVAMLITGLVAGAVITVFYVFIFHFEQTDELTTAQQNGEMVLTILRNPVLHAGLGMPASPDELDNALSPDLYLYPYKDELFIDGPVTVWDGDLSSSSNDVRGNMLAVLYGFPSQSIALSSCDFNVGESGTIDIDPADVDVQKHFSGKTKTRQWVLFPTVGIPLLCTNDPTGAAIELEVAGSEAPLGNLAQYDELYYLRGMIALTGTNGDFSTEDLTAGSNLQPRVDNIAAVYFEHTDGLLKAYVAAAGPKRHDEARYADWAAFAAAFPEWPGPEFTGFDDKWKYHRMRVLSESWRIRN